MMKTKLKFGVSAVASFSCILTMFFLCTNGVLSEFCGSSKTKLSVMFNAGGKVYFGGGGQSSNLFTFDLNHKKHGSAKLTDIFGPKTVPEVAVGVHFDPYQPCNTNQSNVEFCDHSKVFSDMVVLVGVHDVSFHQFVAGKFEPYSHTPEFTEQNDILPSVNSRLYAILFLLFGQVATSTNPKFTAGTYNQFTDTLYLAATVDESVADLPEWNVGKHVLFQANFAPNGLIQDSFVVTQFDHPVTGLIAYNGNLFALTKDNTILQIDGQSLQQVNNVYIVVCNVNL